MLNENPQDVYRSMTESAKPDPAPAKPLEEASDEMLAQILSRPEMIDLFSGLKKAGQDDSAAVISEVWSYFSERFELDRDEQEAFNRLRNLLKRQADPDSGNTRNQIGKIANALRGRIKTELRFF